jgi:hypothetical protein
MSAGKVAVKSIGCRQQGWREVPAARLVPLTSQKAEKRLAGLSLCDSRHHAARSTRVSISLRSAAKSIG